MAGEGPTDLGSADYATAEYIPGPLGRMVDDLLKQFRGDDYSYLGSSCMRYVAKVTIDKKNFTLLAGKRQKKNSSEAKYFFKTAANLGARALALADAENVSVMSILFRDTDHVRNETGWDEKYVSMNNGFAFVKYPFGVPMLPDTCSEAWLLAALLRSAKIDGRRLEGIANRDWLKERLASLMQELRIEGSVRELVIDPGAIPVEVQSYTQFKRDLERVFHAIGT